MTELLASSAQGPDGPILTLAGEADQETIPQLRAALAGELVEPRVRHLTIDAARLEFVDSACLRMLLRAARMLQERGGRLTVARPGEAVARLLDITGASRLVEVQVAPPG